MDYLITSFSLIFLVSMEQTTKVIYADNNWFHVTMLIPSFLFKAEDISIEKVLNCNADQEPLLKNLALLRR